MDLARLGAERPHPPIVRGVNAVPSDDPGPYTEIKRWGANCVRLIVRPPAGEKNEEKFWAGWAAVLDDVERNVAWAGKAGLKVVVDLHEPPIPGVDRNTAALWEHPDLESNFCRAWEDLARRLLPLRKNIWAYDLFNEPLDWGQFPNPPKQWRPLAIKVIEGIRKIDSDVWVIYEAGPGSWYRGFEGLIPLPDYHVIYGGHFYHPQAFTYQGIKVVRGTDLAAAKKAIGVRYPSTIASVRWDRAQIEKAHEAVEMFRQRWHVPIFIGEFSVVRWAPKEDAVRWLRDVMDVFEARGYSWAYHSFRTFTGWSVEHDESYWMPGMPLPKPSAAETARAAALREYLTRNAKQ